ncbi:MAG: hypothetical protein PHD93_01670 [Candidatus Pacebacteria bacterium]|nr:hypothetical protein [Candidatus Paceibacterota bacterium]
MTITFKSVLAWVLIFFGLGLIVWDISTSYYYFTAQKEFPQIFAEPKLENKDSIGGITDIQEALIANMTEELKGYMPANSVSDLLNLSSWIMFAFFLIYAGGKMIGIGNDFLKS